ncbi:MAG: sugar transferase [Clostridia bacterium]
MHLYKKLWKRIFDIILSLVGMIVVTPAFLILLPIVAIAMRGKPFFLQTRVGKGGKKFKIVKLRTMTNEKGADGKLLPDKERLTKFGMFLRKTSIDELPEMWNILVGQMSVVGPRPLLEEYLPLYSAVQNRRHEMRPGLTGLAQVSGRNAIGWQEKFEKDVEYVDNCSLKLDAKIFFLTIKKVCKRDGIAQSGEATMEYFVGNGKDKIDKNNNSFDDEQGEKFQIVDEEKAKNDKIS